MKCEHRDQSTGRQCDNQRLESGNRCYQHADTFHRQQHQATKMVGNGRITKRRVYVSFHLYADEETNGYLERLRGIFTAREGLKIEVKEEIL